MNCSGRECVANGRATTAGQAAMAAKTGIKWIFQNVENVNTFISPMIGGYFRN